ncbi:MAG: CoA-binding protein [Thaumarchaeota archaeon]|nr:CoA-binding protein [Nitrososphaerota archaeon]
MSRVFQLHENEIGELRKIFSPESVAIVGASNTPSKIGYIITENLKNNSRREIYPVNPRESEVQGIKAFPSLTAIPNQVDLAVIAVPAARVNEIISDCGKKAIKFALVITGGFAEFGDAGKRLSDSLLEKAKESGVSIVGPNSLGIICSSSNFRATFSPEFEQGGDLSCISQSGGIWRVVFDRAHELGLGVEKYVGSGNEIDLTTSDYLKYLEGDEKTSAILLYMEGLQNPREFLQVASQVTKKKPIIAIKTGETQAGARVILTHTSSLAGKSELYRALFSQSGVVEVSETHELVDYANLFRGVKDFEIEPGVAIISAGGGLSILAADEFSKAGLDIPFFSSQVHDDFKKHLSDVSILNNPLDLGMTPVDERGFRDLTYFGKMALSQENVGWLVFIDNVDIFLPEELVPAAKNLQDSFPTKRVIIVWFATSASEHLRDAIKQAGKLGIPVFTSLRTASRAVSEYVRYAKWRFSKTEAHA